MFSCSLCAARDRDHGCDYRYQGLDEFLRLHDRDGKMLEGVASSITRVVSIGVRQIATLSLTKCSVETCSASTPRSSAIVHVPATPNKALQLTAR